MTKYKYLVEPVPVHRENGVNLLNDLGSKGWKLVFLLGMASDAHVNGVFIQEVEGDDNGDDVTHR